MDATTEQTDAVSTDAPEAQEPIAPETPTDPAEPTETYEVLDQLNICFLHIHAGLSTRNKKKVAAFIDDFKVFLADLQRGANPLPVEPEAPVTAEVVSERWPSRFTSLALTVHTTDRLTKEQHEAFDEALYNAFKSNPLVKQGGWHEEGLHFEMGIVTVSNADATEG